LKNGVEFYQMYNDTVVVKATKTLVLLKVKFSPRIAEGMVAAETC
jgi:hypothetical protein